MLRIMAHQQPSQRGTAAPMRHAACVMRHWSCNMRATAGTVAPQVQKVLYIVLAGAEDALGVAHGHKGPPVHCPVSTVMWIVLRLDHASADYPTGKPHG